MKRKVSTALTLMIDSEVEITADNITTKLTNVKFAVLGSITPGEDDAEVVTEEGRNVIGKETAKLASKWLIDKLEGRLEDPEPQVMQKEANA